MNTPTGFKRAIIVVTVISAALLELIDVTIVNVALTQMAGSLGATIEDVAWVVTSYAIANVIIIPMTGFLAQYFGRRDYYLASIVLFTVASYLCGNSTSLPELVVFRFIQGIGGGALLSTSQSLMYDAFPPNQRGMASGLFGMGVVLGPTLGPAIGGYIVDNWHWSSIFFVNLPIGLAATVLTVLFIEKKAGEGQHKRSIVIDYPGIVFLAVGIGALQFVLERGESEDWFASNLIVVLTLAAVTGLGAFIRRELTTDHPVVNLRILGRGSLGVTTIFSFVAGLGLFTSVFVYPVMVQRINGFTPTMTGVSLLWPTLAGVFLMPLIGRRLSKGDSPIPYIVVGMLLMISFGFVAGTASGDTSQWQFFPMQLLRVAGVAMLQLPLINQGVAGLQPQEFPGAIAINNMIRQLGGAFGIALANNYVTIRYAQHRSDLVGNLYDGNPLMTERLNSLGGAALRGYRQLELMVDRQAYLLAYLDTFRVVSLFFAAIFPLIYLLIKKRRQTQAATNSAAAAAAMAEAH